ncbi:MAG: hypothetical protein JNN07_25365 [Verrucomicrobiales bacterium]|nr:hypothetical protein [Verrucomicrobiales bacterium]
MNLPRQLLIRIEAWNMRRLYLRDLRKLSLSSADKLQYMTNHLADFWGRFRSFTTSRPPDIRSSLTGNFFGSIEMVSRVLADEMTTQSERLKPSVTSSWTTYLKRFRALKKGKEWSWNSVDECYLAFEEFRRALTSEA